MADALPDTGSTTFVLISAALVLLMTPALALFYGGFVGERMAISTMLMSFAALSIITIEWSLLTYSLAFGTHPNPEVDLLIGGTTFGAFDAPNTLRPGTAIPEHANMVFQLAFAAVTSAVISGGVVGRITYPAWCLFIAIWHVLVYVPLAHWVWGGGWLAKRGVLDFAVRGRRVSPRALSPRQPPLSRPSHTLLPPCRAAWWWRLTAACLRLCWRGWCRTPRAGSCASSSSRRRPLPAPRRPRWRRRPGALAPPPSCASRTTCPSFCWALGCCSLGAPRRARARSPSLCVRALALTTHTPQLPRPPPPFSPPKKLAGL